MALSSRVEITQAIPAERSAKLLETATVLEERGRALESLGVVDMAHVLFIQARRLKALAGPAPDLPPVD